ncbi:hypothetical protein VTK26DRAFT_3945 [Humicola hyalothermophila]
MAGAAGDADAQAHARALVEWDAVDRAVRTDQGGDSASECLGDSALQSFGSGDVETVGLPTFRVLRASVWVGRPEEVGAHDAVDSVRSEKAVCCGGGAVGECEADLGVAVGFARDGIVDSDNALAERDAVFGYEAEEASEKLRSTDALAAFCFAQFSHEFACVRTVAENDRGANFLVGFLGHVDSPVEVGLGDLGAEQCHGLYGVAMQRQTRAHVLVLLDGLVNVHIQMWLLDQGGREGEPRNAATDDGNGDGL